jgi:uncharacterized protein (DUF983 family)
MGAVMYRCPHCRKQSISWTGQLSPRTTCPSCGAELKIKLKFSNFLLPIYFAGRAILGLAFHVHFDVGIFWEAAIVVTLATVQIWLSVYREVGEQ